MASDDGLLNEYYYFSVLGSSSFSQSKRPSFWENGTELYLDGNPREPAFYSTRLEEFPLIDDFEIRLEDMFPSSIGYHIYMFSPSRRYVAAFPYWDRVE